MSGIKIEVPKFDGACASKYVEWRSVILSLAQSEGLSPEDLAKEIKKPGTGTFTEADQKLLAKLAGAARSTLRAAALSHVSTQKDADFPGLVRALDAVYQSQERSHRAQALKEFLSIKFDPKAGTLGGFIKDKESIWFNRLGGQVFADELRYASVALSLPDSFNSVLASLSLKDGPGTNYETAKAAILSHGALLDVQSNSTRDELQLKTPAAMMTDTNHNEPHKKATKKQEKRERQRAAAMVANEIAKQLGTHGKGPNKGKGKKGAGKGGKPRPAPYPPVDASWGHGWQPAYPAPPQKGGKGYGKW